MRVRKAMIGLGLAALVVAGSPRRAEALVFKDVAAFLQRNAHYLIQFQQLLSATRDSRKALLAAYAGLKDWRNLGWVDTLDLVHAPWFDGVEGIEDLRMAADLTALNVEQAQKLFGELRELDDLERHPRYRRDAWFRTKVDGIRRIARRARAHRLALLRQMQLQNQALSEDVARIRRLRDKIEAESKKTPANPGSHQQLARGAGGGAGEVPGGGHDAGEPAGHHDDGGRGERGGVVPGGGRGGVGGGESDGVAGVWGGIWAVTLRSILRRQIPRGLGRRA